MNMIRVTLAGLERDIPAHKLGHYQMYGWQLVAANQTQEPEVSTPQTTPVDSGAILVKPPKKRTAKSAETAPEAAAQNLGNDISKGD